MVCSGNTNPIDFRYPILNHLTQKIILVKLNVSFLNFSKLLKILYEIIILYETILS